MKYQYNERRVMTLINVDNKECYEQMIPCLECSYCMNLEEIKKEDTCIKYIYICPQCKKRLELTYISFIKDVYKLSYEKWLNDGQIG